MIIDDDKALWASAIGLLAGLCGSLAGLGGSMITLPLLMLLFSRDDYHLYVAAGLCVNVLVAGPAVYRHWSAGAIDRSVVFRMLPPLAVCIAVGALFGNTLDGAVLSRVLGAVLVLLVVIQLVAPFRDHVEATPPELTAGTLRLAGVRPASVGLVGTGAVTGLAAGLLGIGGGLLLVIGSRLFGRLTLKRAIACSSTLILLSSGVGASVKLGTLGRHGYEVRSALALAAILGAWAILGAITGARLVHALPTRWLNPIVSVILIYAAARLLMG